MGTAGSLSHTDRLRAGGSASSRAFVHRAVLAAPADTCAACQWTQGVQSQTSTAFAYAAPLSALALLIVFLFASPSLRVLRRRSPRAPPVCFSA